MNTRNEEPNTDRGADVRAHASSNARGANPGVDATRSGAGHKEALLDDALAETFPASDPISPAYEARLEAQRAAAEDEATVRRVVASVATGLASVGAVAAAWCVLRSLARVGR